MIKHLMAGVVAATLGLGSASADTLKIAVLKTGTVNWLMETIKTNGFDTANGFTLETVPLAGGAATAVAFQAGEVDMMVKDWVWAMYMRGRDREIAFAPFSNTLGALMTRGDVDGLCDLKGRKIGVVGGELDKSWLVLQALVTQECGFDLTQEAEAVFGSPPLMSKSLMGGDVDAVSTFWHFAAKLEAAGAVKLQPIDAAMAKLGIDPAPPLIGFVWDAATMDDALVSGFLAAAESARAVMADDGGTWEGLRPMMRAKNDAEFTALRDAYIAGRPGAWTDANAAAAEKLYDLLRTLGGEAFVAEAGPFDPAAFRDPAPDAAPAG